MSMILSDSSAEPKQLPKWVLLWYLGIWLNDKIFRQNGSWKKFVDGKVFAEMVVHYVIETLIDEIVVDGMLIGEMVVMKW